MRFLVYPNDVERWEVTVEYVEATEAVIRVELVEKEYWTAAAHPGDTVVKTLSIALTDARSFVLNRIVALRCKQR